MRRSGVEVVLVVLVLQALLTHRAHTKPLQPIHRGVYVSDLIRYSEAVQYDPLPVLTGRGTRRRRRDAGRDAAGPVPSSKPLRITFNALDREFRLVLLEDDSLFTEDAVFETPSGHLDFHPNSIYSGYIQDEPDSEVHGLITGQGRFDGTISSRGELYYVEPASRYTTLHYNDTPHLHTIIYRSSDVRSPSQPTCASQQLYLRRHQRDIHQVLKTYLNAPDAGHNNRPNRTLHHPSTSRPSILNNPVNRPREPLQLAPPTCSDNLLPNGTLKHVNKRAAVDPNKTTCMLYLQADHLFFQKYGTEEACIEVMTRHVQRVNAIYRTTDFNQDGRSDNISFMIKRIKVHTVESTNEPNYRFPGNYGVEKFLELFSEEDYDAFCLAYMFTYRDFEMGTLGLAWTGDLKNAGGVCEKNGHYRGSLKSLNTGIVTLLNYGKHVPPAVSHVTLAHEIGHNFGSPHDPEMCTPGGEDGNYIMFARATSGDKKNNNKFSPCSLNSINPVLNNKARNHLGCFTEPQMAICGNGVVEAGEECDCGWEEDCRDKCCFPQRRYPPSGEPPCRLTPHSICSPSQGPCCTSECQLKFGDKCRSDNGCRDSSYCDGRAPACPPSNNKPNKTICNEELVCFMGECTGSICLAYGLESCQCIPGPEDPPTKACELCCKKPGDNQPCLSSFEWNSAPYDIPDMFSKPGTPCNDYNGYCDVFQKCREVDPSGPLATLRKLLLSEESIASFKKWVSSHWYAVLVIVATVLILLMLSTKLLGKQADVKLKSITIIHSATTETVRLPPEGEPGLTVHQTAVRSKLPLHRKVREKKLHTKVVSRRKNKSSKPEVSKDVKKPANDGKSKETSKAREYRREVSHQSNQSKQSKRMAPQPETETPPTTTPIYENLPQKTDHLPKLTTGQIISSRLKRSNRISTEITSEGAKKFKEDLSAKKESKGNMSKKGTSRNESPVKRKKRKKEGEDGVSEKRVDLPADDPVHKVHNWLLQSISNGKDNFGIMTLTLPKSRSSPVGLSADTKPVQTPRIVHRTERVVHIPKLSQPRSRSAGNLKKEAKKDEKVKLQVVYRPPFKLSLKLRPGVGSVRTRVVRSPPAAAAAVDAANKSSCLRAAPVDDIDSNVHTVPSDLDVLLSESEFLFSDA